MRVALTIWEDRISPVFDSAHMLLVSEVKNKEIENIGYERLYPEIPQRMIEILKQMNISVLICGAISEEPAYLIRSMGVKLIPFIAGKVENVLDHFSKGKPITPKFSMPGC